MNEASWVDWKQSTQEELSMCDHLSLWQVGVQAHDSLETVVVHVRCYEIDEVTVFENLHEACQPDGTLWRKFHSKIDFFLFLYERFAEHFDRD